MTPPRAPNGATVPVALPLLTLAADLLTLVLWGVALGLAIAWRHTLGRGMVMLANELDKVAIHFPYPIGTLHLFGPASSSLRAVNDLVNFWLGEACLACEHATVFLWNHTVSVVEAIAAWVEDVTLAELHAWESLFTVTLPRYFHSITNHLEALVNSAASDARKAEAEIQRTTTKEIARLEDRATEIVHQAEAVITADVLPRIRTAEHDLAGLKAKLERLTRDLAKGGIVALIGATIWRELFNGVKCSSWSNLVNKRGCGAWKGLEDILSLLVDGLILTDLCHMLPEAEKVFAEFEAPLVALISDAANAACAQPPSGWATPSVGRFPLPPPQTRGALPA